MIMVDCQVTKGGRGGPSFHENHGKYRLCGKKLVIAADYLGLPVGAAVFGARRHDVGAARELPVSCSLDIRGLLRCWVIVGSGVSKARCCATTT
jgi:hypothetical protein